MIRRRIHWLVPMTLAAACAGDPVQTYPGPARAPAEVAILTEGRDAGVLAIDGIRASGSAWSLLPGPHVVWLRVRVFSQAPNVNWTIWSYCRVPMLAAAGERYVSRVRVRKSVAPGLAEKVKMEVGIADSQGLLQAEPDRCKGRRPDLDRCHGESERC